MARFLQTTEAQFVIWTAVLAGLLAFGYYIIVKVRQAIRGEAQPPMAGEMMSEFRNLHSQGALSDEEYQTIKNRLSQRFQHEMGAAPRQNATPGESPSQ